jgi:hypothetical protein
VYCFIVAVQCYLRYREQPKSEEYKFHFENISVAAGVRLTDAFDQLRSKFHNNGFYLAEAFYDEDHTRRFLSAGYLDDNLYLFGEGSKGMVNIVYIINCLFASFGYCFTCLFISLFVLFIYFSGCSITFLFVFFIFFATAVSFLFFCFLFFVHIPFIVMVLVIQICMTQ